MPGFSKHFWNFEVLDPQSLWLFINPSDFAESLGLYIIELGHFFQEGKCTTNRVPENSFSINFAPENQRYDVNRSNIHFSDQSFSIPLWPDKSGVSIINNCQGYSMDQNYKNESYFIQFGGFMAEKYCELLLNNNKYAEFPINWHPFLIETFKKLVLLYRQPSNEKRDVYASLLLTQVLSRLILETVSDQPLYTENNYVKKTLEILEQRFYEPLKLKDISDELHINSSYLSRLITSETGISFSGCLTHVRINHAKKLLQTTSLSIEEIGEKCGFCNASHFVKQFHANEDMTPLQYRLLRRKDLLSPKNLS